MANDKSIKQVSRLTGALLARKGSAAPSPASLMLNQQANRFQNTAQHKPEPELEQAPIIKQANVDIKAAKSKGVDGKSKSIKSSNKHAAHKRIAMTLRMEEEDHLKLRIFSAYTRKSCQAIISEALDLYLGENGDKLAGLKIASQNS